MDMIAEFILSAQESGFHFIKTVGGFVLQAPDGELWRVSINNDTITLGKGGSIIC